MSARIKIDQVGLPAGVAGRARTDGLQSGDIVTLTDVSGTGNSTFHLLWGPPDDPVAEPSLAPTGDPNVWTFEPNSGSEGSYLIELRENGDPVERRIFGIRTASNHLLIPAFNERASRHAGWQNDGTDQAELSDNNAIDYAEASLNVTPYAGWWRSLAELYRVVEAGTGGIADHSLPLVKLEFAPAKSVIANALNVAGDAAYFASSAEFQYLRVNAANDGLEWASLAAQGSTSILYDASTNTFVRAAVTGVVTAPQNSNTATFSVAAGKSVLINAANGSAVPAFVAGTAAFQYLRVNTGNNGLEWATLAAAASTSIIYDAASNSFRRAALTAGDVTAPVNDNTLTIVADAVSNTKAANMAANTIKANPTAGSADPQDMALAVQSLLLRAAANIIDATAAADTVLQRVGSADLGFSFARVGQVPLLASATATNTVSALVTTAQITIPANFLVAGSRWKCCYTYMFVRGATATPLNIGSFFDISIGVTSINASHVSPTVAGTYHIRVEAEFTITTAGAAGVAMTHITSTANGFTAVNSIEQRSSADIALATDTTTSRTMRGSCLMSAAVAGCSLTTTGGHLERVA
jgi:hypothetical protein